MKAFTFTCSALLLTLATNSSIASIACTGQIDILVTTQSGMVELYSQEIYSDSLGRSICNVNSTWKSVPPDTCKIWYSTLLTQAAQKKSVNVYYLPHEAASCNAVATYNNAVAPYAVSYSKN